MTACKTCQGYPSTDPSVSRRQRVWPCQDQCWSCYDRARRAAGKRNDPQRFGTCSVCGESRVTRWAKVDVCKTCYYAARRLAAAAQRWAETHPPARCAFCGADFQPRPGKKFCTAACKRRAGSVGRAQHKTMSGSRGGAVREFACCVCGTLFRRYASQAKDGRGTTCSRRCRGVAIHRRNDSVLRAARKARTGDAHHGHVRAVALQPTLDRVDTLTPEEVEAAIAHFLSASYVADGRPVPA